MALLRTKEPISHTEIAAAKHSAPVVDTEREVRIGEEAEDATDAPWPR